MITPGLAMGDHTTCARCKDHIVVGDSVYVTNTNDASEIWLSYYLCHDCNERLYPWDEGLPEGTRHYWCGFTGNDDGFQHDG